MCPPTVQEDEEQWENILDLPVLDSEERWKKKLLKQLVLGATIHEGQRSRLLYQ